MGINRVGIGVNGGNATWMRINMELYLVYESTETLTTVSGRGRYQSSLVDDGGRLTVSQPFFLFLLFFLLSSLSSPSVSLSSPSLHVEAEMEDRHGVSNDLVAKHSHDVLSQGHK